MTEELKLTQEKLWEWIAQLPDGEEFNLEQLRVKHNISTESSNYYVYIGRFVKERKIKKVGYGRYKKIKEIQPVKWWERTNRQPLNFKFPCSYRDGSEFRLEDMVKIYPGDLILIGGVSNVGKTTMALNLMAENIRLMPTVLMGSEYTAADGKISDKFGERLDAMSWCDFILNGRPLFELLPVDQDYEDYIVADAINIIDWISLPGEYYMIDEITKKIKNRIGDGVAVVVIQKNRTSDFGEGGERAERYADLSLYIDPYGDNGDSMVRAGKVKAPKVKGASGKRWGFYVSDSGANFNNIRELVKCPSCFGRGSFKEGKCDTCMGLKYIDKD